MAAVRALLRPPPAALGGAGSVGIDASAAMAGWKAWADGPADATATGLATIEAWPEVIVAVREGERTAITANEAESVVRRLLAADPTLSDLEVRRAGLAEAFAELTQEPAAQEQET